MEDESRVFLERWADDDILPNPKAATPTSLVVTRCPDLPRHRPTAKPRLSEPFADMDEELRPHAWTIRGARRGYGAI